jgi:CHAT domain-containing protein
LALFYALLLLLAQTGPTTVQDQTEQQVSFYVKNLTNKKRVPINIWALYEVASSSCNGLSIVKKQLNKSSEYSNIFSGYHCRDLEKIPNDYFLHFWERNESNLYFSLKETRNPLTKKVLEPNRYPIIHFLLLMNRDFKNYYSNEYLHEALIEWKNYISEHKGFKDLKYEVVLANIVRASYIIDDFQAVQKYYSEFSQLNLFPNSLIKLRLYGAFDYTFYRYGFYDKSLNLIRNHSLALARFIDDKVNIDAIEIRKGAYLFALGKYEESIGIYEKLYTDSLKVEKQYSLFTNLGVNYLVLGQSNKYIQFQLKALSQDIENYKSLLSIYRNLFVYYSSVKDLKSALLYIDKAKKLAIDNADTTELSLIDLYLASFYWSTFRDHEKALMHLNAAKKVLTPEANYAKFVDLLLEEATIYSEVDSLDKAEELFLEVKQLALSKSNTPKYVDALVNLANIYLEKGNLSKVEENLAEIKLYPLDNLDFPLLTKFYTVKAKYLRATGNIREAITLLDPLITQIINRSKNNTDSQAGYWSVEDEYLDAFSLIADLLIETGEAGKALVILDQLKTINDASLYNNPLIKASKLSEEDLAEEKRLNNQLQKLRKQYLNAAEEKRFDIKKKIDRTSAIREQILAKANLSKEEELPSMWAIRRSIQPDEAVLHFTQVGTKLYLSYLTTESIQIRVFDFSIERQNRFNFIADELASGKTNLDHLYELYQLFGVQEIPEHIHQLTVIPDNYLYRIPLEVLPTQKPDSPISFGSTHYLLEDYRLRYFTSLQEFNQNRRKITSHTTNGFAGFAISNFKDFGSAHLPSLPYATIETKRIDSELTSLDHKKIYMGNEATKEAFKKQVGNSRLIHVATHSEVSEQAPLFSTIYLKNPDAADSLESEQALYAYELFDTPLNSEFIMLNSCSSGSGNYIQGSGVMGISRALRYAGAKSLALNLWSVNDKVAAEFAVDFYGYLNEGITKNEAIRLAKIDQLQKANANPHFWGAYMMIGNPAPITNKPANSIWLFSLLAATTLLVGYSTYHNRRSA